MRRALMSSSQQLSLPNQPSLHSFMKNVIIIIGKVVHICAFVGHASIVVFLFLCIIISSKYGINTPIYRIIAWHTDDLSLSVSVGSLLIIIIIHIDFISQSMRHFLRLFSHTNTEKSVNERYTELSLHNNIKAV